MNGSSVVPLEVLVAPACSQKSVPAGRPFAAITAVRRTLELNGSVIMFHPLWRGMPYVPSVASAGSVSVLETFRSFL